MAGETSINGADVPFDNVGQANGQPYQVMTVDGTNSGVQTTAAMIAPTSGNPIPLGVLYDKAKLDMTLTPVKGSGFNIRLYGIAKVIADGAINAGVPVKCSTTTAGMVTAATKAIAGAQPLPVLGLSLKVAQASGDAILVLLTPLGMY